MGERGLWLRVKQYPNVWHRLKLPRAHVAQLGTKYPSVPTVTSWYLHALWIYLGGRGRQGRARNQGLRPRSLDKLAKPLRWFQLKLAVLPVGSINSELAQTLTSMGELFFPWPHYLGAPSVCSLSLSSLYHILGFPSTFYDSKLHQDAWPLCIITTIHAKMQDCFYFQPHSYEKQSKIYKYCQGFLYNVNWELD